MKRTKAAHRAPRLKGNGRARDGDYAKIGQTIRKHRKASGLTLKEVAAALHVSQQQAWKYERGVDRVSPNRLAILADLFETTTDELIGRA